MSSFTDIQYAKLGTRQNRILNFFNDLEASLSSIGAPSTNHQDILWDGSKVKVALTDEQISGMSHSDQLKYYNQGLGLMKLAMNNQLFA